METTASVGRATLDREDRFRRELRDELMALVEERGIDVQAFAEMTGLLPAGAQALMERKDWSLGTCLRVAESFDIDVRAQVDDRQDPGK